MKSFLKLHNEARQWHEAVPGQQQVQPQQVQPQQVQPQQVQPQMNYATPQVQQSQGMVQVSQEELVDFSTIVRQIEEKVNDLVQKAKQYFPQSQKGSGEFAIIQSLRMLRNDDFRNLKIALSKLHPESYTQGKQMYQDYQQQRMARRAGQPQQ